MISAPLLYPHLTPGRQYPSGYAIECCWQRLKSYESSNHCLGGDNRRDPLVAGALDKLSDPLGGHAGGDELGNLRSRPQSFGAAVVLYVDRSRHGMSGELSFSFVGWGPSRSVVALAFQALE